MQEVNLIWGPEGIDWLPWKDFEVRDCRIFHYSVAAGSEIWNLPSENTLLVWVPTESKGFQWPENLPNQIPIIILGEGLGAIWEDQTKLLSNPIFWVAGRENEDLFAGVATVRRFLKRQSQTPKMKGDSIFIRQENNWVRLPWNKIVWLKSDRVYQEIVMEDGRKWMVRQSLTESMRDLPPHFFRVHRSYVVNLHYLESIGLNEVNIHGHQIPISRKLREELLAELGLKER